MKLVTVMAIAIILSGCSHIKQKKTTYYESGAKQSEETLDKYGIQFSEGKEFSVVKFGG